MELPEDLTFEVLLLLPVKALVRFKSICRSWRSLIDSPVFISRHLNRSASCGGGARSLIVEYLFPSTEGSRVSLLSGQTLELSTPVEVPPRLHSQAWRTVGCCNGVVCFSYGKRYLLWNPATRQHRALPESPISLSSPEICNVYHGFGYDSAADDYKIVRVCRAYTVGRGCVRAEVFALSEGSWREIQIHGLHCRVYSSACVSVGGVLYWGAGFGVSDDHRILSFDLRDEVFRRVCYPDPGLIGNEKHHRLTSYEESLCLIVFNYTAIGTVLDMWVMEGGPGKESWTKRFRTRALIGIHRPLDCRLNGILVEKRDGLLAIFEAGKGSVRDLPAGGGRCFIGCHLYSESLVPVIR